MCLNFIVPIIDCYCGIAYNISFSVLVYVSFFVIILFSVVVLGRGPSLLLNNFRLGVGIFRVTHLH